MHTKSMLHAGGTGVVAAALLSGGLAAPAAASQPESLNLSPDVVRNLQTAAAAVMVEDPKASPARTAALCGDTNFTVWIKQNTAGWTAKDFDDMDVASLLPLLEASYYPLKKQSFGERSQYTGVVQAQMRRLRGFWNVNGTKVGLAGMHSTMVKDTKRVARIYRDFGGMSAAGAAREARRTAKLVNQKKFEHGRHPYLTLNAFATTPMKHNGKTTARRIVMGDGIMRAMAELGWGRVAPQEILAHEYGHQVQIANKALKAGDRTPAQTRYLELMADAYGAYYLHHGKGGRMDWKNVNSFLQVVYATGDCSFTSTAHHGTPNQRMASANWGADMVHRVGTTRIASSKGFQGSFAKKYPSLLK